MDDTERRGSGGAGDIDVTHADVGVSSSSPPAMRSSGRMSAEERRADLIRHAVISYTELGLGRAGHGDVARRAGVSTGTVFNYFPTREALTEAVLDHVRSSCDITFDALRPPSGRISEDIEYLRETLSAACTARPDEHRLFLTWSQSFNPDVRTAFQAYREELISIIAPYVGTGDNAVDDARILFGTAMMYMQMHFDGTDPDVMRRFATRLGSLIDGKVVDIDAES